VTGVDGSLIRDICVGIGVLLTGLGIFIAMLALARMLRRVNGTLDELDRQLAVLGKPIGDTLDHVGGIADTADQTLARLSNVARSLEDAAGTLSRAAVLVREALSPAIVNAGATIAGVSAGLRRLVTGKNSAGGSRESDGF